MIKLLLDVAYYLDDFFAQLDTQFFIQCPQGAFQFDAGHDHVGSPAHYAFHHLATAFLLHLQVRQFVHHALKIRDGGQVCLVADRIHRAKTDDRIGGRRQVFPRRDGVQDVLSQPVNYGGGYMVGIRANRGPVARIPFYGTKNGVCAEHEIARPETQFPPFDEWINMLSVNACGPWIVQKAFFNEDGAAAGYLFFPASK